MINGHDAARCPSNMGKNLANECLQLYQSFKIMTSIAQLTIKSKLSNKLFIDSVDIQMNMDIFVCIM